MNLSRIFRVNKKDVTITEGQLVSSDMVYLDDFEMLDDVGDGIYFGSVNSENLSAGRLVIGSGFTEKFKTVKRVYELLMDATTIHIETYLGNNLVIGSALGNSKPGELASKVLKEEVRILQEEPKKYRRALQF